METTRIFIIIGLILVGGLMKPEQDTSHCKDGVCSLADRPANLTPEPEHTKQENTVIELNVDTFATTITTAQKPVVVDFYATWCAPCKIIKPIFAELSQEEDWLFCSLDVDQAQSIAMQYKVTAMPMFVVFKNGIRWGAVKGALEKKQLKTELSTIINAATPVTINDEELLQQLIIAINEQSIADIKRLIGQGANVNGTLSTPFGNSSPMQTAIISGNKEIIDLLFTINSRMDQQVQEATEKYLNQFAVIFENYEQNFNYVKSRIPVAKPEASTPNHELGQEFLTAISKPSMLKELLEKKVDINCTFMLGKFEVTPLYLALAFNNKTAIDMLIDAGASLSTLVTDETGCKKTVAEVIQAEIDKQNAGTIKSKERLRYALGKAGL